MQLLSIKDLREGGIYRAVDACKKYIPFFLIKIKTKTEYGLSAKVLIHEGVVDDIGTWDSQVTFEDLTANNEE